MRPAILVEGRANQGRHDRTNIRVVDALVRLLSVAIVRQTEHVTHFMSNHEGGGVTLFALD